MVSNFGEVTGRVLGQAKPTFCEVEPPMGVIPQ